MKELIIRFTVFLVLVFILINGIDYIHDSYESNGVKYLEDSIKMAVNSTYASEGKYPDSLESIVNDYNIVINEDKYVVFYESLGSNIRPEIRVIRKD